MVKPDLSCRGQAPSLRRMRIRPNPHTQDGNLTPYLRHPIRLRIVATYLQPCFGREARRLARDKQARY
eukprot:4995029-Pleurochrysis_carterae.AAC.1